MKKLKIVTILGTRPEIIRLSKLIPKLDKHTEHFLIHTGQNFSPELSQVFFDELELREPDVYLESAQGSLGAQLGTMLSEVELQLQKIRPDGVVILGDTNSALSAIIAERLGIPVFHLESGNRSFDREVPEELNRKLVDHIASYNLCYTETARRNLMAEGLHRNSMCVTGTPLREVIDGMAGRISKSNALETLKLKSGDFFLVSAHRQETVDNPARLALLLESLNRLADSSGQRVIVSTHPRTASKIENMGPQDSRVVFLPPFGFSDYLRLQVESRFVLSDSGSLAEEASILGLRAATIRRSFERQEALDSGLLACVGLNFDSWMNALDIAETKSAIDVPDYSQPNFSDVVLNFINSKLLHDRRI